MDEQAGPAASPDDLAGSPPLGSPLCPACQERLTWFRARFCEACGAELDPAVTGSLPSRRTAAAPLLPGGIACRHCSGRIGADGYCTTCGLAALEPVAVDARGAAAAATHRGRRHARNEDAAALARTSEGWPVVVVADGVSHSDSPDLAAGSAARAAAEALEGRPFAGTGSLRAAVDAAQGAVCAVPSSTGAVPAIGSDAACTLVVAVATDREVVVANVGDTRAYLLRPGAGTWEVTQLTVDDSVGHALTAWLGAGAARPSVHTVRRAAAAGDALLVCTDGLWNYAPDSPALAHLAGEILGLPGTQAASGTRLPVDPASACAALVDWAIDSGGADNISVALAEVPGGPAGPCGGADDTGGET